MCHPPDSEQHHHAEFGELHLLCWTSILVELSQHVPDLRERLCGWWVGAGRCGVLGNAVGGVSWGWGGMLKRKGTWEIWERMAGSLTNQNLNPKSNPTSAKMQPALHMSTGNE